MKTTIESILKIAIKVAIIVVGVLGIVLSASSDSFMGNGYVFMFFTVQSNLTIMGISLVFLVNDIRMMFKKESFLNNIFYLIKYTFTIAILITFLVFFIMLAPTLGIDYLLSFKNFSLHAIVPILAIIDFFIFDKGINLTYRNSLVGTFMPIYYLLFFLIGIPLNFRYSSDGLKAPYFFLNYEEIGWFAITDKGPGVFIYVLILLALIVLLGFLFTFLMNLRQKKGKSND